MIPKSTLALYNSIKAPDSLQQRIEAKLDGTAPVTKRKNRWAPILAAAACSAIIIAASLPQRSAPALSAGGVKIGTAPVVVAQSAGNQRALALMAASEPLSVLLELPAGTDAQCSVSHGEVLQEEDPAGKCDILRWVIADPQSEMTATLALTIENKTHTYTLHADAFGVWYMEKEH